MAKIHRGMAKLDGVDIFYLDTRTEGPAILCLHGRWGRGETWTDFIRRYGDRYRIIAPDQRGHGLSGRPEGSYETEEMAQDMLSLLDRLGLESAIIVGHSMGGGIAACMAAAFPGRARALAILDKSASGPKRRDGPAPDWSTLVDPVTGDWPLPFPSLADAQDFMRGRMESPLSFEYFMASLTETVEGYTMLFSGRAMAANASSYHSWFDILPRIACPVLLVKAKGDGAISGPDFARMRAGLADCRAQVMTSPDHNVHLANKAEFYACFDGFLDGLA